MPALAENKMEITPDELIRIQAYLRSKFGNEGLAVRPRAQTPDSIEVILNGEFIGVVYKDEDEGEVSYDFNMAILDIDLPEK
ncbi:MAG: DUF3126 family protein [Alphaproteobacteria bacterium]|nr:DUF3126 family protein [Alphaproteobacteria bacterium]NCQ87753.1 DUF3126 family protein [Alphaproteobacteria bacterium]NCT05739.1 DUF3126 family protein [Alphaproteobacteria bacterium]